MLWFTIVSLVASLTVAVSIDTTLAETGDISWSKWGARVLHCWAGDATGIAMLAPPLLLLLGAVPWAGSYVALERSAPQINIFLWRGWQVLEWVAEVIALVSSPGQ